MTRSRILLPALVLVVVTGLTAPLPTGGRPLTAAAAQPQLNLRTPVFSLRRLPEVLRRRVATARLAASVDRAVGPPPAGPRGGETGRPGEALCIDVRDGQGNRIYARQPDLALIPASTVKVVTARAVLDRIGPDHRLRTEVRGGPVVEGILPELWLVGGGDPLLSTADYAVDAGFAGRPRLATPLEALADRVVAAGIRRIGRLTGDDSRHDRQRFLPGWLATYASRLEITPLSALSVNKSLILERRPVAAAGEPASHAAGVLAGLLGVRGVRVDGIGEGVAPPDSATVAAVESPPLVEVVGEMLQNSDNLAAEMLLRELGRRNGGAGSTAAGLSAARAALESQGIDTTSLVLVDGSGLDRAGRASCSLLTEVLTGPGSSTDLLQQLPVAGTTGTLIGRLAGTPAQGRVRAKTGSLNGVSGLAGWAMAANGDDLAFSLLANDVSQIRGGTLGDALALALVAYPDAPPMEALGPLPPIASGKS